MEHEDLTAFARNLKAVVDRTFDNPPPALIEQAAIMDEAAEVGDVLECAIAAGRVARFTADVLRHRRAN